MLAVSIHQNVGATSPPQTRLARSSFGFASLPAISAYSSTDIGSVADGYGMLGRVELGLVIEQHDQSEVAAEAIQLAVELAAAERPLRVAGEVDALRREQVVERKERVRLEPARLVHQCDVGR